MRPVFRGVLGFGLVAIPVEVFKALDDEKVGLHWIHQACHHRIQYQKWCPHCQRPVANAELVKVAEVEPGAWVPAPERTAPPADRVIGVMGFLAPEAVDPLLYKSAYWVGPGRGGAKPYRVLLQAMQAQGVAALARAEWRAEPQLALVRVVEKRTLALHTLYWPESLRLAGMELGDQAVSVSPKEAELAERLIGAMRIGFDPKAYPNEARAAWWRAVEERAKTDLIRAPAAETWVAGPAMADLLDRLEASLKAKSSPRGRRAKKVGER
ncbi:MAG: Ku domain-containing protein [Firmicutes bacterium]|nr:Ku domain-containing protein [Alicyclobacillaceae bacterium]MCL6496749.1 Ku domain-containing protein [Bacillota bacterium]